MRSPRGSCLALALLLAIAQPALAEDPGDEITREELIEELNEALASRDQVILELMRRVEALEKAGKPAGSVQMGAAATAGGTPQSEPTRRTADEELEDADRLAQTALERTLIKAGGLLLPAGALEIEPSIGYALVSRRSVRIDCLLIAEILCIGDIDSERTRQDRFGAEGTLRLGLPWDSQLDVRVPFGYATRSVLFGDETTDRARGFDLGDVEVSLSHQLTRDQELLPDLLAAVRWKSTSGSEPFDVDRDEIATGSGFHDLQLALTAVKVRDPVVLFGSVSYTHSLADHKRSIGKVQPGGTIGLQLGMAMALNLETSLNFGWTQSWADDTEVDGAKVAGSFERPGSLRIGATYVPAAGRSIDFGISFGLTDDSPDVEARFSFPLSVPTPFGGG